MTLKRSRTRTPRWSSLFSRRCIIVSAILTLVFLIFVSSQIRLDLEEKSFFRKIKLVKHSWFERQYVGSWIQGKLLAMKWESYVDAYCKQGKSLALGGGYTKDDYLDWTVEIAEQLGFKDGHSIFDNGCGCGAFLVAFNLTYNNVKVGGLDLSNGAITFAKETFPQFKDNFKVGSVEDLSFVATETFDHAMTFFTFPYVSPEVQCKAVKEMVRIVKPGGTLYVGHNLESDCFKNHIGIYTLPLCFWNEQCLAGSDDIEEIYYIKERDLFGVVKYCPEKSAVFIRKKGVEKQLKQHAGKYYCDSKFPPSGRKN
ncbi:uncharacterized protein LOC125561146 [Nematostella vectensis]|uniref:uncharacterized protein LOC125561146 n=1 Tax=Nematostella vectensis TaxID=45351 RepID=UPI0020778339|nr:uncharacterized protein LOC125561146 [Nematostella vectensis]